MRWLSCGFLFTCRHIPFSSSNSPDEAHSAENTLTKPKIKRRFTFTKGKTTKMRQSEAGNGQDFSTVLFRRRKESKTVTLLSKRDSSDDSSITSGLNWSIPYDLPGAVERGGMNRGSMENVMFMDDEDIRARCRSTPTIVERRESESGICVSDTRVSWNGITTVDVGIQVNGNEHYFQFPDVPQGSKTEPTRSRESHKKLHKSVSVPSGSTPVIPRKGRNARSYRPVTIPGGDIKEGEEKREVRREEKNEACSSASREERGKTQRDPRMTHVASAPHYHLEHTKAPHHKSRERWRDDDVRIITYIPTYIHTYIHPLRGVFESLLSLLA